MEGETERCGGQGREVGTSRPKELGWKLAGLELKKMVYPELVKMRYPDQIREYGNDRDTSQTVSVLFSNLTSHISY